MESSVRVLSQTVSMDTQAAHSGFQFFKVNMCIGHVVPISTRYSQSDLFGKMFYKNAGLFKCLRLQLNA